MAYVSLNLGLVKAIFVGVNPPTNTNVIWFNSDDGLHYVYDSDSTSWAPLKGASEFTGLTDVPNSYSGSAGKFTKVNATEDGLEFATVSSTTNLAYTQAASNGVVTSDTGTDATILAADATYAGLMIPAQFTKLSYLTITQAVDLDAMELDVADLTTLTGVASNSTSLGTFTGSTIPDNSTIKASDQALETAVELRISGSGTSGYIPKYTAALTQGNSNIYDTGTAIGIFNAAVAPTFSIGIEGNSARSIGIERHTTAATAGNNFTIKAGGAYSTGSNLAGGNLIASSGIATGTGSSNVQIWTATAGSTGATDRTPTLKATFTGAGALNFESGGFVSIAGDKYLHYTHATLTYFTSYNTYLGYSVGTLTNTGKYNTAMGSTALSSVTNGEGNTMMGKDAGVSITTSNYSTCIGYNAGSIFTGESNTCIGQGAGANFTSGTFNSYLGRWAGLGNVSSGSYNVMLGYNSGATQQGSYNAGFGSGSLNGSSNTGSYNTACGSLAGLYIRTTSQYNTFLGYSSGQISGAGPWDYGIAIGANSVIGASNTCSFGGNADASKISTFYFGNAGLYTSAIGTVSQSTITMLPGGTYYNGGSGAGANMGGHNFAICSGLATGDGTAGSGIGDLYLQTSSVGASGSTLGTATTRITIKGGTGYIIPVLPTSSAGLPTGALWSNSGVVTVA